MHIAGHPLLSKDVIKSKQMIYFRRSIFINFKRYGKFQELSKTPQKSSYFQGLSKTQGLFKITGEINGLSILSRDCQVAKGSIRTATSTILCPTLFIYLAFCQLWLYTICILKYFKTNYCELPKETKMFFLFSRGATHTK